MINELTSATLFALVFFVFQTKVIGHFLSLCYNSPNILKIRGINYENTIYFSQRASKHYE